MVKLQHSALSCHGKSVLMTVALLLGIQPVWAQAIGNPEKTEAPRVATTVAEWTTQLAQASVVQVTGVRVDATATGLAIVLESNGALQAPATNPVGNALIADIPNATIAENFEQVEPSAGIARVTVTPLPGKRVRVAITGTDAPPNAEVKLEAQGLVFAVTAGAAGTANAEDEIQVVVTGEQDEGDEGYNPSSSSTATRTDTPLRDIPASVQVIPGEIIEDQGVTNLRDAVRNNAPGVSTGGNYGGFGAGGFIIRGFEQGFPGGVTFRNGFRDIDIFAISELANIERVEVLRGPASILFGQVQPGGIINIITEQPLSEPTYTVEFTGGQFSFYRPEIDFSGPLTEDGNLLYRLSAAYQNSGSFRDFVNTERFFVAPVLQWNISEDTSLTVDFSYLYDDPVFDVGLVALDDGSLVLPINRYLGYPSLDDTYTTQFRVGYSFEHEFNDNWQIRNAFSFSSNLLATGRAEFGSDNGQLIDNRFLQRVYLGDEEYYRENYQLQTDLIGTFSTGSVLHELSIGFDLNRLTINGKERRSSEIALPVLDIFAPNYNISRPEFEQYAAYGNVIDSLGIYLQDRVDITDNLHLLLGGRFDFTEQEDYTVGAETTNQSDNAFSPNVGVVYQPSEPISLYASYSRSFSPVIGRSQDGSTFTPERGTQYEVGIKADINEDLSATLAAFDITKTNVLTSDPDNSNFSIQVGEQRSQGIEFIITGEILPGWNISGGYAYTNARATKDNSIPEGDFLSNVPENTANLWTTYEIQSGDFQGLGLGLGLLFVGERQSNLPNDDFQLPSYVRADAALFYRRDNWRTSINVNNLFDTEYYEGGSRVRLYPGAPINVQATLSYTF